MKKLGTVLRFFPFYLMSVLPMWLLYRFSDVLFLVVYYGIGYRKKVVRSNLVAAFPDKDLDEIQKIEHAFYRHFCDLGFEAVKTLTISEQSMERRFVVKNPEVPGTYLENRQNVLVYAAHLGNWEWLVCMPLYIKHSMHTFYKPLQNNYFNDLFLLVRQRFGVQCTKAKDGYRLVLTQMKRGKAVLYCLIADQSPRLNEEKSWQDFFGMRTAFLTGPDKIGARTNAVFLFPYLTKTGRGRYELEFKHFHNSQRANDQSDPINGFSKTLEKTIKQFPFLWLWSHRRWKLNNLYG
ncbi:lysophospholipid acyltransferase family protein [Flavobacteriaceae bacterium TP-CH-4]|uniref:Lysophospholipid acyltransferase family protein n=2 Tax=Pelagihabitans pacificus TaxID=2696054 RepID=A0A967EE23_9FLAO|nr:lysophospholipid acyltransferase family protein [Pelagihabitans pacificus]